MRALHSMKRNEPFRTEADLVELYTTKKEATRSSKYKRVVREFDCKYGIADVVYFDLKKNWAELLSLGDIDPTWCYALRLLPYRKIICISDFAKMAGVSNRAALSALKNFEEAGFCIKKASGWMKVKQPQSITKNIVSIEAKLRDWNRALKQAYRYKEYSDETWVLLDEYHSSSAKKNLAEFSSYNIGLATINVSGSVKVYFKPKREEPRSKLYSWTANAKLAGILADSEVRTEHSSTR